MYEVTMPKLSDSMEVGKIIKWRVKEGDEVHEGDVLAEVESDKANMELECFRDGTFAKIVHGDDEEVPVGEVIAFIAAKGEDLDTAAIPGPKAPAEKEVSAPERAPAPETPPPAKPPAPAKRVEGERVAISPYARELAREKGIDYGQLQGTGPGGRIVARDIEAGAPPTAGKPAASVTQANIEPLAAALAVKYSIDPSTLQGSGPGGQITVDDVEVTRHRDTQLVPPSPDEELPALDVTEEEAEVEEAPFRLKTQARRVIASKHAIPHFYITRGVDVTALLDKKDEIKEQFGATVTHLIMLACVKALEQHPEINRSYDRGRIVKWKGIHLGLAIDTEQGLTVAVLRDAQDLSLKEIVERSTALVEHARAGKLSAEERRHPTFTITNLGMFDVEHFEPIINPPSAVTLAVASALPTPVVRGDAIHIAKVMKLTAACDHRIIDGAAAAGFMKDLRALLEDPGELL